MLHLWTSLVLIARVAAVPIPWPQYYSRNATYELDKYVCVADDLMFRAGEVVPSTTPCHQCTCRPPNVECELIPCEKKIGCRTLQLSDQCCPQYQCECESNGRIYNNGQKLEAPGSPCQVCYCRGGQIVCTLIQCYKRDDCKPQQVPGRCCPKYDHCPPLDNRISSLHAMTGWPTQTTSFNPSTPLDERQHPSATTRYDNTIFFETSASNRFELLGEPPQSLVVSSSLTTTVRPYDAQGGFKIVERTGYDDYSTGITTTSFQHSSNPSTDDEHSISLGGLGTEAAHNEGTTTLLVEASKQPATETGEPREGDSSLLGDTTNYLEYSTKPSIDTGDGLHKDDGTQLEVTTTDNEKSSVDKHEGHEEDSTSVENSTFLGNPSTVTDEEHAEDSTLDDSSEDLSTGKHKAYEEDSTQVVGSTTLSYYPSTMKEEKLEETSTQMQDKTTLPEDSLQTVTTKDEVHNTESSQSPDIIIYPEVNETRLTSLLHKIGSTDGFGNVRVTLIKFQRRTTLSPLISDLATERTSLPSESLTSAPITDEETTTTQHPENETQETQNSESKTGSETTTPSDMIAQESEYSPSGNQVSSSASRTDTTEIPNNASPVTSQGTWSNSVPNGFESSVSGQEVATTQSSGQTVEPTDGEKESSTYSTTSNEESQRTTGAAANLHTSGDESLGSAPGGSLMDISTLSQTKPEVASTTGSLPHVDKSEETWEHHRPTQMVTDEIQYITTVNPNKYHSEGENVFSASSETNSEPSSQHTDQTIAPPSVTSDTLSTRFNKLGEIEYTTSQPNSEDLSESNYKTESDKPSTWDPTEQSDETHSEEISTESTTTNPPSSWNGYDGSDESNRYVKLGEVVSQTGTTLLESGETNTDEIQSNTQKYTGLSESENESTTSTGEKKNVQDNVGFVENTESSTSEGSATESTTTVSSENEQSDLLNTTSLSNDNTKSTENQLLETSTTFLPTVLPHGNSDDHSEISKEDTTTHFEPLDRHIVEISTTPFEDKISDNNHPVNEQSSTFNEAHQEPTTTFNQDNEPPPIFKLSEEMSNHQMVLEIHHINTATSTEDSAEEAFFNDESDSRDKEVTEEHTNNHSSGVTGKVNNNTSDLNVSVTEGNLSLPSNLPVGLNETVFSTLSTNMEDGEDERTTIAEDSNEKSEHTTIGIHEQENTTNSVEQPRVTETASTEQQDKTNHRNNSEEDGDNDEDGVDEEEVYEVVEEGEEVANQTEFDDIAADSVTKSGVTEVPQDVESTSLETDTSTQPNQDIAQETTTDNGGTNENLNDKQTEQSFESQEGETTIVNTEPSVRVEEVSEHVELPTTSEEATIASLDSTTEDVVKSPEENITNAEIKDKPTDSNSSPEEYTVPPETSSFEGGLEDSTANQEFETSITVASIGESQEITQNILNLNSNSDILKTDPVLSENNTEQESTTEVTENSITENNTELPFTSSSHGTTNSPVTTTEHELESEYNITDIATPSPSVTGIQQETSSEIEDTLDFQSNKTNVGNNNPTDHESATEIEHHTKFQSNKTKDPDNHTVNGTTSVDFMHTLPSEWLKEEHVVNKNQSEGYDGEVSTRNTPGLEEGLTIEPSTLQTSGSEETDTPKITSVDDSATTPESTEGSQSQESSGETVTPKITSVDDSATTPESTEGSQSQESSGETVTPKITSVDSATTPESTEGSQSQESSGETVTPKITSVNDSATTPESTEGSQSQESSGETVTPKITSVDSATTPESTEGSQSQESIYTRLQREDAQELGKYDLETLQNFFKNLYIQDDSADASTSS